MKNGGHHHHSHHQQSQSFLHRWLSRTNKHAHSREGDVLLSDGESERSISSPPPLTESSSTTDSSSFPPPTPAPVRRTAVSISSSLKPVKPVPIHAVIHQQQQHQHQQQQQQQQQQQKLHESSRPIIHQSRPRPLNQTRLVVPPQSSQSQSSQSQSQSQSTISFPTNPDVHSVDNNNSSNNKNKNKNNSRGGGGTTSSNNNNVASKSHPRLDVGHVHKPASSLQVTRAQTQTPRLKGVQPARLPSSRVKTPWTPPSRTIMLPADDFDETTPVAKARHVMSLPPNSQRPTFPTIALHPLVAYHPTRRTIMWDLVLPITYLQKYSSSVTPSVASQLLVNHLTSKPLYGCSRLSDEEWSEYISHPPLPRIRIITDLCKWPVEVRAQSPLPNDPRSFLTVKDVLYALHDMTRQLVSDSEFHNAPSRFREQLMKARERRLAVRKPIDIAPVEQKMGMRRVDYLLDMTMFAGLERRDSDAQEDLRRNDGFVTLVLKLDPHWS